MGKLLVMIPKYRKVSVEDAVKPRKSEQKRGRGQLIQWPVTESRVTEATLRRSR